jgi:hypothetical protein
MRARYAKNPVPNLVLDSISHGWNAHGLSRLYKTQFRVQELERKRAAEDEIGLSEEKSKVATQATAVEDLSGADTGGGGVSSGEDTNAHKNPYSRFGSRSNARKSAK